MLAFKLVDDVPTCSAMVPEPSVGLKTTVVVCTVPAEAPVATAVRVAGSLSRSASSILLISIS